MKKSEFRKLIREEVKSVISEAKYPITVSEIMSINDMVVIVIGNSSADMIGYKPAPADLKSINSIMKEIGATPFKGSVGGDFSAGNISYACTSVFMDELLTVTKKINALKLQHKYK
jgi:hypothetical protein